VMRGLAASYLDQDQNPMISEDKTLFFFHYQGLCAAAIREYYDTRIKPLLPSTEAEETKELFCVYVQGLREGLQRAEGQAQGDEFRQI